MLSCKIKISESESDKTESVVIYDYDNIIIICCCLHLFLGARALLFYYPTMAVNRLKPGWLALHLPTQWVSDLHGPRPPVGLKPNF